jgi:hypothetical protein
MSHVPPRFFAVVEFALRLIATPLGFDLILRHPESLKTQRPFGINRKALHLPEN